ncbi:LysR family transcriptional regulator [Ralstonia solanacearum]|uniref:LysR family transcriptional regulator n=1 Tax=Ralstonia solanacearum TaxID=305 RepID=UPI0001816FE6|nr:LysR family transcriptional regulator [Ralstonia solanacearum]MDC6180216.1 LysR family transcriptional regulator [Ralstonia solanacearum]MDC6212876.1 LysR family transcriptional regulator [Ralstonia solanacearum]MDD7801119.1 LysR family transcriptional regulator [Ralstonia solanacearum]TYZ54110.1 LysR family transcriptional regulator [Ralstonia solanacearum]
MLVAQLKSFFMVARLGSITLAAKQLGLSQPTVTSQIRALEEAYGVELFYRGGRRLALSDAGVRLMPLVDQLVHQETEIDFFLRNSGDMGSGHLRIGATAPYYVLDLLDRFCRAYPGIDVSIEAGNSVQMLDALQEYRVDVASSSHRVEDARFLRIELARDPLVLVVHRDHPLAQRGRVPVAVLAQCRLLVREVGSTTRAMTMTETMLAQAGVAPASTVEIGSRESIREAIMRNLGVSVIARQEVPSHPDLRVLPFEGGAPELSEYLYCLQDRKDARLIAAFLAQVRPVS